MEIAEGSGLGGGEEQEASMLVGEGELDERRDMILAKYL